MQKKGDYVESNIPTDEHETNKNEIWVDIASITWLLFPILTI